MTSPCRNCRARSLVFYATLSNPSNSKGSGTDSSLLTVPDPVRPVRRPSDPPRPDPAGPAHPSSAVPPNRVPRATRSAPPGSPRPGHRPPDRLPTRRRTAGVTPTVIGRAPTDLTLPTAGRRGSGASGASTSPARTPMSAEPGEGWTEAAAGRASRLDFPRTRLTALAELASSPNSIPVPG
jgi:hypothetical protein